MYGFKTGEKPKTKGAQKSGMIRGPGTGTSDDVKAVVPEGSYIMPADSTEAIGPEALASMGKPVPVNLSNGEYQMPPEQVHAIGAQVLDQMKDATHEPVGPRGFNAQDGELYFADGGKVESTDDLIARISAKYGTSTSAAPKPGPTPVAQRPAPRAPAAPSIGSAADTLRNRRRQIDAAAGYADGGVVEDDERKGMAGMQERGFNAERNMAKPQTAPGLGFSSEARPKGTGPSPQMGAVAQGNARRVERMGGQGMYEQAGNDLVSQAFPNTATAIRGAGQNIAESYEKGGIPAAVGATVRNTMVPAIGFAADVGRGAMQILDPAANALKTAVTGDPTPIEGTQFGFKPAAAGTVTQRPNAPRQPGGTNGPAAQGFDPAALTELERNKAGGAYRKAWQRESAGGLRNTTEPGLGFYNAEQQVRGTGITAQRGANGVMEFSGTDVTGSPAGAFSQGFDLAAGNERMARANADRQRYLDAQAGAGGGPRGGAIGSGSDPLRDKILQEASAPHAGAQGGRLTARQLASLENLRQQDAQGDAASAARDMQQQQFEHTASNDAARLALDQQRVAGEAEARGIGTAQQRMMFQLQRRIANPASPEDAADAARQLAALQGKETADSWKPVSLQGGTDAYGNRTESILAAVNSRTGEMRRYDGGGSGVTAALPRTGEVRDGYRFKGGNPADQANWERV